MTFDYKKEYKEFYMPKGTPSIVRVPKMNYIAVRGSGNPNDADGEYKQSIGLLYGIAFTIKMKMCIRDRCIICGRCCSFQGRYQLYDCCMISFCIIIIISVQVLLLLCSIHFSKIV